MSTRNKKVRTKCEKDKSIFISACRSEKHVSSSDYDFIFKKQKWNEKNAFCWRSSFFFVAKKYWITLRTKIESFHKKRLLLSQKQLFSIAQLLDGHVYSCLWVDLIIFTTYKHILLLIFYHIITNLTLFLILKLFLKRKLT
jgi:hypothetical protein